MKLDCNVVRDLLPLYHDGVCSEESRALVEEHLKDCAACSAILAELRGEMEVPHGEPDDRAVLKKLHRNMKRAWIRGAAVVLTAVLLMFGARYGWWYVHDYRYYQQFVQGHAPVDEGAGSHSYRWSQGGYEFCLNVPRHPGEHGMVSVYSAPRNAPRNIVPGREVEISLYFGREDYFCQLVLSVTTRTAVSGQAHLRSETTQEYVVLDADLDPIPAGVFDQHTHDRQAQVLKEYDAEIMDIIRAAQAEWPFLAEE